MSLGLVPAALLLTALVQVAPLEVEILRPPAGEALFDIVVLEARVEAADGDALVRFLLDGEEVARREAPPYRVEVDVGPRNRERRLEVVATDSSGRKARAVRVAPAIAVDEELELDLQQLYISVFDRRGEPVLDLARERFTVREEGTEQRIVTFAAGDIAFTAELLIDGSYSMRGAPLATAFAGAKRFVESMGELDEARLLVFSDRLLHVTPYLAGGAAAVPSEIEAQGGSAVLDHLYLAASELENRHGRRVVILLSDGADLHSVLSAEDVADAVHDSAAIFYWIRLGLAASAEGSRPVPLSCWRDSDSTAAILRQLEELAEATGGRALVIDSIAAIGPAFAAIQDELRGQYAIGYYPSERRGDGSWRRVEVRVRGWRHARTRGGYRDRPRR